MEYFHFFGIQPAIEIDETELRKLYMANQRQWHPDYFVSDPAAHEEAMAKTTFNNQAYAALSDFYRRLEYLLQAKGWNTEEKRNILPPEFLMEMMDINDLIESHTSGTSSTAGKEAETLLNQYENQNRNQLAALAAKYANLDNANEDVWNQLLVCFHIHKYLLRLRKNLVGDREM